MGYAKCNSPMSSPPKKLSLDFIMNKDQPQSNDDQGRRRMRHHTPVSPPPSGRLSSDRQAYTPYSFHQSTVGSSAGHARAGARGVASPASVAGHESCTSLQRHFQCEICHKSFVERGNLNKHISSVHLKEKNKVCPEPGCGKSFSFRDGLVRHIAHVHKNQRRYACQLCQKTFKQASHLAKHMRSIHKEE